MRLRTKRLLMGSCFIGLAAHLAIVFLTYNEQGSQLLSGALVGFSVAVGTFYLCYAQSPD